MTGSRRYLLYKDYQSGLCNEIMSVELAVGLAHLTGRTLVYYGSAGEERQLIPAPNQQYVSPPARRDIVDQERHPTILDLLKDVPVPSMSYPEFRSETEGRAPATVDSGVRLVNAVFVADPAAVRAPALDAFAEGRTIFADCDEEVLHIKETNLGYYSRLFFEPDPSVYAALAGVVAKKPYRDLAATVCGALGAFNGIHVRLNDFRKFLPFRGGDYPREILKNLSANLPADRLLVISTDETDNKEFFEPITRHFRRHVFVDEFIVGEFADAFRALPFSDEVAVALLSNLVLQQSHEFLGTPGSTFSGVIQREVAKVWAARDRHSLPHAFKFIYRGGATVDVPFADGLYLETKPGPYSWNRLDWSMEPETKSWYREWPEAIPASRPAAREATAPVARADAKPVRAAGWSTSSYGRWSVTPPDLPRLARAESPSVAFDRAAIQRLLQSVGTELLFGGDAEAAVARLESWGAPEAEARRIIDTAVSDPLIVNGREMAAMLRRRDWLLESLEKLQQLSARAKTIERRTELSGGEFLEFYYARNRPVVIQGEMAGWPALSKWTLPFLREAAGLLPQGGGVVAAADETAVEIAMGADAFSPLTGDLGSLEKFLERGAAAREGAVRIAQPGSFAPLRADPRNALLAQIAGRTRLKLVAAADSAKVYGRDGITSEIGDLEAPERALSRFPLLANVRIHDIVLEPGEILFLPMAWWRQMRALEFGVLARYVNFRWPNDMYHAFPAAPNEGRPA